MERNYQSLINGIFVCALPAVNTVLENENIQMVMDLRAEAGENEGENHPNRLVIPLIDGKPNQSKLLEDAIQAAVHAYHEGKQVVLH
ncbi:hypothetical protein [Mesobacillus campisalis]|uniref:hypothetical protein n=1 Tax=Mesobacillus campisalis TaxID=1408103 RepID=UPI00069BBA55|nr:hypothetical protein [Mesobacillus campisalis]